MDVYKFPVVYNGFNMKNIKTHVRKLIDLIFNESFFYFLAHIQRWAGFRIRKARGRVELKKINNRGKNCIIQGEATIVYPERLVLGDNVRIGYGAFIFCIGGVSIGENTQISRNVLIYSGNHDIDGKAIPFDDQYVLKEVVIGRSVWIGMNVTITPGVKIGNGAIIGMGTVISKDVPEGAVVVGSEQRIIKYRDMNNFYIKDQEKAHYGLLWPSE